MANPRLTTRSSERSKLRKIKRAQQLQSARGRHTGVIGLPIEERNPLFPRINQVVGVLEVGAVVVVGTTDLTQNLPLQLLGVGEGFQGRVPKVSSSTPGEGMAMTDIVGLKVLIILCPINPPDMQGMYIIK